jgi:hypothetical protein
MNYFKAFCSAAPYAWAYEKYWYEGYRDVPYKNISAVIG